MATYDLRHRADANKFPHNTEWSTGVAKKQAKVFNAKNAAAVKGSALTTADIAQLFDIPAYSLILGVTVNVKTAEGAACTIDVGDSGSASRYFNDLDVNATGVSSYITPYFVTADTDLRVTLNTAATDVFIAEIVVVYIDVTCQAT